ncbi:shikimate dehydrogenase [Oricola thermophila]|uniref:Shikimate dehydrogenase (NADP(+)) n=1 Tax=Oricola thermophila TaxID=2742145 RepID=A0A6N1VFV6_9HYPH|nr:shikimate dehydrogenase [Oricola thermophila]QKV19830.1 shikimate dehydrogenase [Oricola thermophila]
MADASRAFVAGHPIAHSRSPLIHGTWLIRHGIDGSYTALDVPAEEFRALTVELRSGRWVGGNVTIPHKETAYQLVDRRDAAAEAIGAVNTLWLEDGLLVGGNTDAYGFAANLDQRLAGWRSGETALVLGAGGASRAIIHALFEAGFSHVDLVNRTVERAERIAARFGDRVTARGWDAADRLVGAADLVVNTTPLGMKGQPPLALDFASARADAMATDIVYVPLETPFLRRAAEAGLKTCDGLGMLLHQAVPGFARWFGCVPEVDEELRDIVIADMAGETGT